MSYYIIAAVGGTREYGVCGVQFAAPDEAVAIAIQLRQSRPELSCYVIEADSADEARDRFERNRGEAEKVVVA